MFELKVKNIQVLKSEDGVSKSTGKPWQKITYKAETDEKYPKTIVFAVFGEDAIKNVALVNGESATLGASAESREYNGKYYTDIQVFCRIDEKTGQIVRSEQPSAQTPAPAAAPSSAPQPTQQSNTDLPF